MAQLEMIRGKTCKDIVRGVGGRVIDGETRVAEINYKTEKIRLIGVDTP